ncbi:hypothetical protein [Myceligenerans indicum]|uniref:Agglutinin cell wall attachment protein n=1 Tax=Myceligenerans indicum TaxID=2593663 RepID=A0ABS1LS99_9MICO|nr:hypothetical protein [Myceligenerans indicum]MBL0888883.1 agglutinin cell wall attachment protein [Myceligenerans indicum]
MNEGMVPPAVRAGELVQQLAREIALHVSDSGDWHTIVFVGRNLSRYAEGELTVHRTTGEDRSLVAPVSARRKLMELRDVMYQDGAGTWFSIRLTIMHRDGRTRMGVDYNYDDAPQWDTTPASSLYTADLIKYPRDQDKMPDWLVEQVARAQTEYPPEYEEYEYALRQRRDTPPGSAGGVDP